MQILLFLINNTAYEKVLIWIIKLHRLITVSLVRIFAETEFYANLFWKLAL